MAGTSGPGSTQSLEDGHREALQALVSSLSPQSSSSSRNLDLGEGDLNALSERLGCILGGVDEPSGAERRNEQGQLVNDEGLPIIDITEPYVETSHEPQAPTARIAGRVPDFGPPTDTTPSDMKAKRRAQIDSIFDALEEEERMDAERERRASEPVEPKLNNERKLAQRELQKKMGKALIRDFKEQREKEQQEEVRVYSQPPSAVPEGSNGNGPAQKTVKPKKSVSFNVPEDEDRKPAKPKAKPVMAWGDVSVNALKSGLPRPRLKSEEVLQQPMRMEVIERIPGQLSKPEVPQCDSDDESDPEVPQEPMDEDDDDENITPPLDGDEDDSYGSDHDEGDLDEDEFDFSDAAQQREMALEYMRLRGSIGEDAYRAMTSHSHEGEDEWDQPEVPLEATLASKPYTPGVSRFRAERESRGFPNSSSGQSTSLGTTVLPSNKAATLQKVVRTGKLGDDDKLVGPAEDSASEGEDAENVKRSLEMLKNGILVDQDHLNVNTPSVSQSTPTTEVANLNSISIGTSSSPTPTPAPIPTPVPKSSSSSSNPTRPSKPPQITRSASPPSQSQQSQAGSHHIQPSLTAFATPLVPPDPSVLSNFIVESPSFPPPLPASSSSIPQSRVSAAGSRTQQPQALVQEVKESAPRSGSGMERKNGRIEGEGRKRPSRFLAERWGIDDDDR